MEPAERRDRVAALDRLRLISRRKALSSLPGGRPGLSTGFSVDFSDYRRYSPGDEVRYIDWTLYARLRKLYSKQFQAESELRVHLFVDVSRSMGFGAADKLDCARRIARALAYVGLRGLDHVGLVTFSDRVRGVLSPQRSGGQLVRILEALRAARPEGATDFTRAFEAYGRGVRGGGLAMVISDFFSPGGFSPGLEYLLYRRFEVALIQVIADEELAPSPPLAEVELADLEDPLRPRLLASPEAVDVYRANLEVHRQEMERFSRRHGLTLARIASSGTFDAMVLALLDSGIWEAR